MTREWLLVACLAAGLACGAQAAEPAAAPAAKSAPLTAGEVKKVDKEAKKVTIKHGPIENLKMPAMTMVFRVKDAAMLDGLAPGTHVRFHAEETDGGYLLVTRIQPAKAK
jgi:Cu(I)/Ag(I) efflux system protein CusF